MRDEINRTGGGYPGSFSLTRFNLDPDPPGAGGGGTTPAAPVASPDPEPTPRATPDLSGLSAAELAAVPDLYAGANDPAPAAVAPPATPRPTDPNVAATQNRQATGTVLPAATPAATPTIRDAARQYGFNLDQYQDDGAAFLALVQAAQRGQSDDFYARLGRQVAPQAQQFQQYLATQRPAQATPERPAYLPPEFDESLLNFVDRDEATGIFRAKPGHDPAIADKVNKYADWMGKFQKNPTAFIQPLVEDRARVIAAEVVREQLAGQAQTATVNSIVEANGAWLYQANEQGQRYVDAQGRYIPTPAGARYMQQVQELGRAGVKDPATLDRIAQSLVRAEFLGRQQAPAAGTPAVQSPTAPVARPNVNSGQAVHPSRLAAVPGATEPSQEGLSLAERLRLALAAEGVSDADVYGSSSSLFGS